MIWRVGDFVMHKKQDGRIGWMIVLNVSPEGEVFAAVKFMSDMLELKHLDEEFLERCLDLIEAERRSYTLTVLKA
jgi:hypothetical protein